MAVLFEYPASAAFGRVLPKSKIYEHAEPSSAVKESFIRQVEKIVWQYKLSPETVNLKETEAVPEIQIFSVLLRTGDLKTEILRCIDNAIPLPVIFELLYEGKRKVVAAYKRPAETGSSKWITSEYFESDWQPANSFRQPLPMVLNLEALYSQLLGSVFPYSSRPDETLKAYVERLELARSKQKEIEKCRVKLRKEKQFNRKVDLNSQLRNLMREMEGLTA